MKQLAILGGTPVRETKIHYGKQYIDDADCEAVTRILKSEFITTGPMSAKLEARLCELTGAKHAITISNGTAALHAACFAAGIEEGDEVITTPLTFAASANCALYCGARPVFADVNEYTYNICPEEIEKKITEKTKAVVVVDFTGQVVPMKEIREICDKYNLILIEDAAHSIGSKYDGVPVGSLADLTTFSFHPVKTVTGGEGGAVLTSCPEMYEKLVLFRTHGITRDRSLMEYPIEDVWYYEQIALGYNYRLTDFQSALIYSQLDKLERFAKRRKEIVRAYDEAFSQMPEIIVQHEIPESDTVRHLYIIQLNTDLLKTGRNEIFNALSAENVQCNVHYIPVYYHPYYEQLGYEKGICPVSEKLFERFLSIPLYYSMTDEDVESVIDAIQKVVNYYKK